MWKDGREPAVLCSARRTDGNPCQRPPIKGSNVCRTHGGAAPQVRARAQVRILMASDLAASKLIEMMSSPKVADNIKLAAAKDLLDRANLSGTQSVELTVEKRMSFEDYVEEALVDANVIDYDELDDIEDAVVVEDEPPVQNRYDRAAFREVESQRSSQKATPTARARRKAIEAYIEADRAAAAAGHHNDPAAVRDYEAMLLAKENGTYNPSSRGEAMRDAGRRARDEGRTTRQSTAKFER